MAKLDAFDAGWFRIDGDKLPLHAIKNVSVVPMSDGYVALMIETVENSRHGGQAKVSETDIPPTKTQVMMTPDYARRIAAILASAANDISPTN